MMFIGKSILITTLLLCSLVGEKKGLKEDREYILRNTFKACFVGDQYSFGDESFYLSFSKERYLKQEIQHFDKKGNLTSVTLFRSEDIVEYDDSTLLSDSLLLAYNEWKWHENKLVLKADSVLSPIRAKLVKFDLKGKKAYCILGSRDKKDSQYMYVYEVW